MQRGLRPRGREAQRSQGVHTVAMCARWAVRKGVQEGGHAHAGVHALPCTAATCTQVSMYKKVGQEKLPSLKSHRVADAAGGEGGEQVCVGGREGPRAWCGGQTHACRHGPGGHWSGCHCRVPAPMCGARTHMPPHMRGTCTCFAPQVGFTRQHIFARDKDKEAPQTLDKSEMIKGLRWVWPRGRACFHHAIGRAEQVLVACRTAGLPWDLRASWGRHPITV